MSNKKKVAGVDRPYTAKEIGEMLCDWIKEGDFERKAGLDYFSTSLVPETEIKREDFKFYALTDFGNCEGIYTDFYIDYVESGERINVMTAKTLYTSEQDFVNMSEMGARLCCRFHKFVNSDIERFMWYGYNISYTDEEGKEREYCWSFSMERVAKNALYLHKKHGNIKVFYTDMATRVKKEYKFQA